jgi:hypothetical protein
VDLVAAAMVAQVPTAVMQQQILVEVAAALRRLEQQELVEQALQVL